MTKIEEKPVKQRKPKSEAQIKQFAEMASKRMQNIAIENKQKKLAEAKRLLAEEEEKQKNQEKSGFLTEIRNNLRFFATLRLNDIFSEQVRFFEQS